MTSSSSSNTSHFYGSHIPSLAEKETGFLGWSTEKQQPGYEHSVWVLLVPSVNFQVIYFFSQHCSTTDGIGAKTPREKCIQIFYSVNMQGKIWSIWCWVCQGRKIIARKHGDFKYLKGHHSLAIDNVKVCTWERIFKVLFHVIYLLKLKFYLFICSPIHLSIYDIQK